MRRPTFLLTLVLTLTACGGDSAGPVDSGLPAEKTGKDLTVAEQDTLCRAGVDNLERQNSAGEQKEYACVFTGLTFTALAKNTPEECEVVADMCRNGAGEDGGDEGGDTCNLNLDLSTCGATIADIEACFTEKNEARGDVIRSASCNDAGKPASDPVVGPACAKIKTTCPGIA